VAIAKGTLAGVAADVFVERNYFTKEQGEKWLAAALSHGLDVHVHADEFSRSGGSEIAIALAARQEQHKNNRRKNARVLSVDHCQFASDEDLKELAARDVVAVALPTTSFFSNISYISAQKWRQSGVRAVIATDFNPGSSPSNSLWFAAYLALTKCGFTMPEVYAGVTVNAARALGVENDFGVLKEGAAANLVAFYGTTPEDFFASPMGDHVAFVMRGVP
jgi:imidazolonepropionase